ncbi:hypothetical protein ACFSTD_21390 [Novosphingobium colocasiae]
MTRMIQGIRFLVNLAHKRARRSLGVECDIFKEYFVYNVKGKPIQKYLLDMTRHTPRDFLQLLSCVQGFYTGRRMADDQINSGLREYSITYFLPEIRDELSGYSQPDEIDQLIRALARVGKTRFQFQ